MYHQAAAVPTPLERLRANVVAAEARHIPVVSDVNDDVRLLLDSVQPSPYQVVHLDPGLALCIGNNHMLHGVNPLSAFVLVW